MPNSCLSPNGTLVGISDRILGNLLAVKQELCGGKFELKVNDVVFVGHPKLLVDHGAGGASGAVVASNTTAGAGSGTTSLPNQNSVDSSVEQQSCKKTSKEVSTLTLFNVVFVSTE